DNRIPYSVYGQMQDDGSMRGPSHLPGGFGIPAAAWTSTGGCETGWATPDPVDPNIVWGGCYAGVVERFDAKTGQTRTVSVWPERTMGANAGQIKLRMNWTFPIAISPHDHNTVYVGSQYVHATSDGGQTWKTISPDLTTHDPSMMGDSGGLTVDNLSVEYAGVVYSIAESPKEKGVIWAGTNDGQVQVTRDGGAHWSNVTPGIPGLAPKGTVGSVDPSPFEGGTCYVAFDHHQVNGFDPLLYKTADYGKTWKSISGNIPKSPLSYTHVVREDPFRKGLLYAGTENALYVSFDDGAHWEPLQSKLPHAPVYWLTVQPHFHDLVVGTYGRGFFILDDVTPLEQWSDSIRVSSFHFFEPRPAYRFRSVSRPNLAPAGVAGGRNPAYGATINYWLKEAPKSGEEAKKPGPPSEGSAEGIDAESPKKSPVEITIWNEAGEKIRTISGAAKTGFNRIAWDLRYEPTEEVRIRTTPPGNPHIWEEKRFRGKDRRGVYYYGIDAPKRGPLVPPGTYTVKVTYAGKEETQKLVVRKDPNSAGSDADVEASAKFARTLARDVDAAAGMINQVEWTRLQLEGYKKMLRAAKAPRPEIAAAEELEKKIRSVEDRLLQPTLAEADLKSFRGPLELYLKLVWLLAESETGGGDVSGNADFPPTQAEREVYELLGKQLAEVRRDFDDLYGKTIPAFNETAKAKGFALMTVKEPPAPRTEKPEEPDED
ncbi:MAG TPA: sialidase, partial [Thermoanaerobaculia bacterium]|nr:sialidase [Thermoanaerobaculia bacterium]